MHKSRRYTGLILSTALLGLTVFAFLQRQAIYDWARLYNYQAPAAIAQLATDTSMNNLARHVYYVQYPELNNKEEFNNHCQADEQTIVLGCYVPRKGIYVLKVDEPRLQGVEQVTAAHEMLHAAYERLSGGERKQIDTLIKEAYAGVTDKRIISTIDQYEKAGADTTNELHSILGTEVRNLPPGLETYYRKYFIDRGKVVTYSEQYEQAFSDSKSKVDQYDLQLSSLKVEIEEHQADLDKRAAELEASRAHLDQLLATKQVGAYNAGVPSYNAQINAYNAKVAETKKLIDQYNSVLDLRNALALDEQNLFQAIDSRPTTQEKK